MKEYKNHPIIVKVKKSFVTTDTTEFPEVNAEDINGIVKFLNTSKATGDDHIPLSRNFKSWLQKS